jgi:hypothetical protein
MLVRAPKSTRSAGLKLSAAALVTSSKTRLGMLVTNTVKTDCIEQCAGVTEPFFKFVLVCVRRIWCERWGEEPKALVQHALHRSMQSNSAGTQHGPVAIAAGPATRCLRSESPEAPHASVYRSFAMREPHLAHDTGVDSLERIPPLVNT